MALLQVQTMAAAKNNLRPERKCLLAVFMVLTLSPSLVLARERKPRNSCSLRRTSVPPITQVISARNQGVTDGEYVIYDIG
jgi:hypothetical protein